MLALFSLAVTLPNPSWQEEAIAGGAASDGSDDESRESESSSVLTSNLSEDTESESRVCDDDASDHSDGTSPLPAAPSFMDPMKVYWESEEGLGRRQVSPPNGQKYPSCFCAQRFFTKS